jgi:hypothetical protein
MFYELQMRILMSAILLVSGCKSMGVRTENLTPTGTETETGTLTTTTHAGIGGGFWPLTFIVEHTTQKKIYPEQ